MQSYTWPITLRTIFERAGQSYRDGDRSPATLFTPDDKKFLTSIGCTAQEMFDFVEDFIRLDEPSFETVLLITAARRDYFLVMQKGQPSGQLIDMATLPSKRAKVEGIEWLPRIIAKARAKLRGEMPPELMYCCGGDRGFLTGLDIEPSDFLRVVWSAGDDDQKIVDYVLQRRKVLSR